MSLQVPSLFLYVCLQNLQNLTAFPTLFLFQEVNEFFIPSSLSSFLTSFHLSYLFHS